jgi:hypothetical protein
MKVADDGLSRSSGSSAVFVALILDPWDSSPELTRARTGATRPCSWSASAAGSCYRHNEKHLACSAPPVGGCTIGHGRTKVPTPSTKSAYLPVAGRREHRQPCEIEEIANRVEGMPVLAAETLELPGGA